MYTHILFAKNSDQQIQSIQLEFQRNEMIFTIKSTNKNMSYILNKNPKTNILTTTSDECIWFEDENTIVTRYKDPFTENSFNRKNDFNYLDSTKVFITVLTNNFKEAFRQDRHELDLEDIYTHTLTLNSLCKKRAKVFIKLIKTLKGVEITETKLDYKTSTVKITTKKSLYYLLNIVTI